MEGVWGLYTVLDKAAEKAGPVFVASNDATAGRNFRRMMVEIPEWERQEYALYRVGSYDDQSMLIEACDPIEVVVQVVHGNSEVKHG